MEKICKLCGSTFIPKNGNQKYCMQTKTANCEICGAPFTYICTKNNSGSKHTCNNRKCKIAYAHQKSVQSYESQQKLCKICGKEFTPKNNTQSICDRVHKFNCIICGKEFVIPREHLTEEKLRQTCSAECKRKLMSRNNIGSQPEAIARRKSTCLERYGVEHAAQSSRFQEKMQQTYQAKTGYVHPSHNPEVRSKSAKSGKLSKLEKKICDLLDNYDVKYQQHYMLTEDELSHEFDFYLSDYKILIDADGVYFHSYLSDPDGKHSIDYYDDIRISLIPDDHMFYLIVEGDEDRAVKRLVDILKEIDSNLFDYDSYMFKWCRSIEFPYPSYSDTRMRSDWTNLCKYENVKYINQCRIGESILLNFHRSLYDCKVHGYTSPLEAWNDDMKLKKVIANRLIYENDVDPSKILRGFNVSKICPRVSVFNPILAKYLIQKYLSEFQEVFDPFSGFSGRMLGTTACGKRYIGQDLNSKAVEESNEIISYLNLQRVNVSQEDIFESYGIYECLLTCPPYSNKEVYATETKFLSCDDWIEECLRRFKCKKYVFVIDHTEKFKNCVKEELKSTSHFNSVNETVVVISQ